MLEMEKVSDNDRNLKYLNCIVIVELNNQDRV